MGRNIPGRNFPGVNFPGGSFMGGNFPGGNFPRTIKNQHVFLLRYNDLYSIYTFQSKSFDSFVRLIWKV